MFEWSYVITKIEKRERVRLNGILAQNSDNQQTHTSNRPMGHNSFPIVAFIMEHSATTTELNVFAWYIWCLLQISNSYVQIRSKKCVQFDNILFNVNMFASCYYSMFIAFVWKKALCLHILVTHIYIDELICVLHQC